MANYWWRTIMVGVKVKVNDIAYNQGLSHPLLNFGR